MRSKTSVRPPVIAGASRQRLSELLRTWRRQPRQRSLLLFWSFLSLALMSDSCILFLGVRLLGLSQSPTAPPAERHIYIPYAANAALWEPLRHWAIRVEGRTQLFESYCDKAVRDITGDERFEGCDPLAVTVSWWLDGDADALSWNDYPCLRCEDAKLRAVLYSEKRSPSRMSRREQLHGRYVEPSVVRTSPRFDEILHDVRVKGRDVPLSSLERKAVELRDRLKLFEQIRGGNFFEGENVVEMQTATGALRQTYHTESENADLFAAAMTDFLDASRGALRLDEDARQCRRLGCEAWMNEYAPSHKAAYLSVFAVAFFAAAAMVRTRRPQWRRALLLSGLLACLGCLGWASSATLCGAIRDGAPVSEGAQAMIWTSFLILGLSLSLALLGRDTFLAFTGTLVSSVGFVLANRWPPAFAVSWPTVPHGIADDPWLRLQVMLLFSALATLALAWAVASLTLARILAAAPTAERVRGLSVLCVQLLRIGIMLLTASALLDGCRALGQGAAWRVWNVQALATLVVLPGCAALVYARRHGWIQPFAFLAGLVFGFTLLALMGQAAISGGIDNPKLGVEGWFYAAGLVALSLAAHAALRYYFGRHRILEA